ncbi:MAG: lysostaphin resistance A-like protein [Candidatus Acidiferrales bacterium]
MKVSRLFLAPDGRLRATWRAFLFIPATGALIVGFGIGVFTFAGKDPALLAQEMRLFLSGVASAPAVLLASFLFLRWFDRRSFRQMGFWFYDGWAREFVWGLAGGAMMISAVVAVMLVAGGLEFRLRETDAAALLLGLGWNLLLFLPPAAFEEFLFRGYLFQRLVEGWGEFAAIFLLSALFGLGHITNPSATPFSVANTVLIGILFAVTYLRTRGLWLPLGLHYAWNFWLGTVVSLPVSGIETKHRLFDVTIGRPDWLTGGGYGPEASALTTGLVLAATVWLLYTRALGVSPAQARALE